MKLLWGVNAALWFINAIVWAFWAHLAFMGGLCFAASILFAVFAKRLDEYDYTFRRYA